KKFFAIVMPQLLTPGYRDEDFQRLKDAQLNALKQDLRNNNEEELGKERLIENIFRGTPLAHPSLGTIAGLESITLGDVKQFVASHYTRGNLVVGISGDYTDALLAELKSDLAQLPAGGTTATGIAGLAPIAGHKASGLEVEIVKKDTRATAISFGLPLPITRRDPEFAA